MTLENLYNAFTWMSYGAIAILAMFGIWYIISVCRNGNTMLPAIGIITSAVCIIIIFTSKLYIETKLYPEGQCPNCEQAVTTRYCEDCGWENDSYYEITDK